MKPICFEIPGDPVAKARPRATMVSGRARMYTPAKTENYEARVALFASQAMAGAAPLQCAVALTVIALFPIPPSWTKKRQAAARAGVEQHTKKPDLDNVVKAIKDGANGILWTDDSQVCTLRECRKGFSDTPRVIVRVEPLEAKRRVFVCGPMTGLPELNYPAFMARAAELRAAGYHVENPAENPAPACGTWAGYMRLSIPQLCSCDAIDLLPGWAGSRGATAEHRVAVDLGIPVFAGADGHGGAA